MTEYDHFANEVKSQSASYIETERKERVLEENATIQFGEATSKI